MADITKQGYEEFRVDVDFGLNMEAGETLVLGSCTIVCVDNTGTDVSSTLLDSLTKALVTGNESELPLAGLQVLIKGGTEDKSKYKYTFKGVTSLGHKWEKDLTMKIKER